MYYDAIRGGKKVTEEELRALERTKVHETEFYYDREDGSDRTPCLFDWERVIFVESDTFNALNCSEPKVAPASRATNFPDGEFYGLGHGGQRSTVPIAFGAWSNNRT